MGFSFHFSSLHPAKYISDSIGSVGKHASNTVYLPNQTNAVELKNILCCNPATFE